MVAFTKPTTVNDVWASAGIVSAPTGVKITQGWTVEIPPYQYFNWSQNRVDSFIAHVNQYGISQWDSTTEYQANKSLVQEADGTIYRALTTNVNKLPSANPTAWTIAFENYGSVAPVQAQLNTLQTNYNTLANLTNYAQARLNMSVFSRVESDARFANIAGSNSNRFKVATAVSADDAVPLGQISSLLQGATEVLTGVTRFGTQSEIAAGVLDTVAVSAKKGKDNYLMRANNLSDLSNVGAARNSLGLTSTAITPLADILTKAENLAGIVSVPTARANLGLGTIAVENASDWLSKAGNLAGLSNTSTARSNLGLGNSATRNVGTTTNTVAAGDDSRIVNAVQNSRGVFAGNGMVGGGALGGDITLHMGAPGTLNAWTGNSATPGTHHHAIDINSWFGDRAAGTNGWYVLPGGFIFMWGHHGMDGGPDAQTVGFPRQLSQVFNIQLTNQENAPWESAGTARVTWYNGDGFGFRNSNTNTYTTYFWYVVGML